MAKALYAIFFIIYQVNSQKFNLGSFPGPLPYERFSPCAEIPCGVPSIVPQQSICQTSCNQPGPIINVPSFVPNGPNCGCGLNIPQFQQIQPIGTSCQQIGTTCQQIGSPCQQITSPCQQLGIPCQQLGTSCQQIVQPCSKSCPIVPSCAPIVPSIPNLPCSLSTNPCNSVSTTVIDNTLANSLANAIQLLIVSNLLENTLGSNCGTYSLNTVNSCDVPCYNNVIDLVSPDYYCSCDPFDAYIDVPCITEPVVTYQAPCVDVNPINTCFTNGINLINDCGCSNVPFSCSNMPFGSNGQFNCVDGCSPFAPVAAEVLIPSAIPAQLTCNFGYMPTTVPCVSVNVEPLPFQNGVYY